jgi:hypothetical protein
LTNLTSLNLNTCSAQLEEYAPHTNKVTKASVPTLCRLTGLVYLSMHECNDNCSFQGLRTAVPAITHIDMNDEPMPMPKPPPPVRSEEEMISEMSLHMMADMHLGHHMQLSTLARPDMFHIPAWCEYMNDPNPPVGSSEYARKGGRQVPERPRPSTESYQVGGRVNGNHATNLVIDDAIWQAITNPAHMSKTTVYE